MLRINKGNSIEENDHLGKCLTIYVNDSHYRYFCIHIDHVFEVNADTGDLIVYRLNLSKGTETIVSRFRKWDYFIIE